MSRQLKMTKSTTVAGEITTASQRHFFYRAVVAKDRRFDGCFFIGVKTTGIYCRPVCKARQPKFENVRFFIHAAAAENSGFRPCRRCHPEASPESRLWQGTYPSVERALRILLTEAHDEFSPAALAERVGMGERQLRRLFAKHLGASPHEILQTHRLDFAYRLINETTLPMTEVALASGFNSVRRFNAAFKTRFLQNPSDTRKKQPLEKETGSYRFVLSYRPPYHWKAILEFLSTRAIPGVECVTDSSYARTISFEDKTGWIEVRHSKDKAALELTVHFPEPSYLMPIVEKVKEIFDLEADPWLISKQLGKNPVMKKLLAKYPGLRVPGAWSGFEIASRAVLGQQVSVKGARTLAHRLVQKYGKPLASDTGFPLTHLYPRAGEFLVPLEDIISIGMPSRRAAALRDLAHCFHGNKLQLDSRTDRAVAVETLMAIPGIGPWTCDYIAMRALRDPNAFPESDLIIKREVIRKGLSASVDSWQPWRAYAVMYLWKDSTAIPRKKEKTK